MKPTRAFLAGLTKPNPVVVPQAFTGAVDWPAKFMKLIYETKDLRRLEMIQKWINRTINLNEVDRAKLQFEVAVAIYTLPEQK